MRPSIVISAAALAVLASRTAQSEEGKVKAEHAELHVPGPLEWETGTDRIKSGSETVLIFLTEYLRARPEVTKLRIETHAATEADGGANQRLSEKRALFIARWLLAHGIDCKRLVAVAFGDTKPGPADPSARDAFFKNNRSVFINVEIRGKPLNPAAPENGGGKPVVDLCQIKPI
jgi:OOP family OmpA-OmpF porin